MTTPTLCKKHLGQVGNYFDRDLALEFELDEESCLICNKVIFVESARRFIEQEKKNSATNFNLWPRFSPAD